MRKALIGASAVAWLVLAGAIFTPSTALFAGQDAELGRMIASAKTAADHEAIAAVYERMAAAAKAESEMHEKMGGEYKKVGGGLIEKQHLDEHCRSLAELYAKIARENEALAKAHREMAKAVK
jgi:hypothetical protein